MRSSLKFHLSDSEDDQSSLERIHTFNLKEDKEEGSTTEEKVKEKRKKAQVKSLRSLISAKVINGSKSVEKTQESLQMNSLSTRDNLTSVKVGDRINSALTKGQKVYQCYVEE
jgi:hypothetical protein